MATKKTTKKVTTAASTTKQAPVKSTKTTVTRVTEAPTVKTAPSRKMDTTLPSNLISIVLAEVIGTFILTLVVVGVTAYFMLPLYVGLVLMLAVLGIGAISGAHINPAVTFGLWSMRKLKTVLVPFYWAAQFLGAMAAVVLIGVLSNGIFAIHFDHFMEFSWGIFAVELVGMAIFMFGIAAVAQRVDLSATAKAIGIGMSLTIGLLATGSLFTYAQNVAATKQQEEQQAIVQEGTDAEEADAERAYPRELYIGGATLNPAVALAVTEKTDSQLMQGNPTVQDGEKAYTRLSMEVILATFIGAALGGNLYLLIAYRARTNA